MSRFLPIFLAVMLSGCAAYQQPRRLDSGERSVSGQSPYSNLVARVEIAEKTESGYENFHADQFTRRLQATGLFKNVVRENSAADVVFYLKPQGYRQPLCATPEASVLIMTLGLVPVMSDYSPSYIFQIRAARNPDSTKLEAEYKWLSKAWTGWLPMLANLSPDWTFSQAAQEKRNSDRLKLQLILLRDEIIPLLGR